MTSRWLQRYTSFLFNPNDFGLAMVCAALVGLGLSMLTKGAVRVGLALLSMLSVAGLLLSSSRGGYLALAVGLIFMVLAVRSRRLIAIMLVTILTMTGILLTVPKLNTFSHATVSSFGALWNGTDKSAVQRRQLWSERASTASLSGLGYGGNVDLTNIDIRDGAARAKAYAAQTVDNSWLKLFIEEGFIGVLLLGLLLLLGLRRAWLASRVGGPESGTAVVIGAVGVAFIFRSLSVDLLDINPWNWFLWMFVGLAASLRPRPPAPAALRVRGDAVPQSSQLVMRV